MVVLARAYDHGRPIAIGHDVGGTFVLGAPPFDRAVPPLINEPILARVHQRQVLAPLGFDYFHGMVHDRFARLGETDGRFSIFPKNGFTSRFTGSTETNAESRITDGERYKISLSGKEFVGPDAGRAKIVEYFF